MATLEEIRDFYDDEYYARTPEREGAESVHWDGYRHLIRPLDFASFRGEAILDVACGRGELLSLAGDSGLVCHGIDISEKAIQIAGKRLGDEAQLRVEPAEEMSFAPGSFGIVTCLGSIEHFADPHAVLHRMHEAGRADCRYVFVVPNRKYLAHRFRRAGTCQARVMERLMSREEWARLFLECGYRIERVLPDLRPASMACIRRHPTHSIRFWIGWIKALVLRLAPLDRQYQIIFHCRKEAYAPDPPESE